MRIRYFQVFSSDVHIDPILTGTGYACIDHSFETEAVIGELDFNYGKIPSFIVLADKVTSHSVIVGSRDKSPNF